MADIFISYKSERRPAARHLKKVLEAYFQVSTEECVWYDYGLIPGREFEPRIMAEIAAAKVVLVLWCTRAVKSEWVLKEAREAKRTDKFLPIRIESCTLPDGFAGADTINLSEWDAGARSPMLDRLLEDIGRRLGREPVSRLTRLREVEEDWRGYGAPSLAHFALGKALEPGEPAPPPQPAPVAPILGPPPAGLSANLRKHWENAQRGEPEGLFQVGWHLEKGKDGLAQDDREAVRLYRLAADQDFAPAMAGLGAMYNMGRGGLAHNDQAAVRLYRPAAEHGNARAQNNLGAMYQSGRGGLAQDDREAVRLYRLAADQGNAQAQNNLGFMYESGRGGLARDDREAVRLYRLAADQGDAHGQNNLGTMHAAGRGGLRKDNAEAVRLYRLAARQGNLEGKQNLNRLGESW